MAAKLKVYRTPIGFHDAYVAAPSQKAALKAWGAESNLFSHGAAETVTNPAMMEAALASPGQVVRIVRGSTEEHLAALPKRETPPERKAAPCTATSRGSNGQAPSIRATRSANRKQPLPRPDRTPLDKAERALASQRASLETALAELEKRRRELTQEIDRTRKAGEAESAKLEGTVARVRRTFNTAMDKWRART